MVSDSVPGSLAVSLMVSLPVLLALSLICLLASGQVFDSVSGGSSGCVLAVLWPCLWLVICFIYLFLWLCPMVPRTVSPGCLQLCVELFLCGPVSCFGQCLWLVSLLCVWLYLWLWPWLSVWQCPSLNLSFCLVDSPPVSSDEGRRVRFGNFSAENGYFPVLRYRHVLGWSGVGAAGPISGSRTTGGGALDPSWLPGTCPECALCTHMGMCRH